jgi:hypothetical protein
MQRKGPCIIRSNALWSSSTSEAIADSFAGVADLLSSNAFLIARPPFAHRRGLRRAGEADGGVAVTWSGSYLSLMTTQEKTNAIQQIVTNHKDNVTAAQAANISAGLNALVIEAMNNAFEADLAGVFALRSSGIQRTRHA